MNYKKIPKTLLRAIVFIITLNFTSNLSAQTVPIVDDYSNVEKAPELPLKKEIEVKEEKIEQTLRIEIKGIKFLGNKLISDQELEDIFLKRLPQSLSFNDMQSWANEVTNYYRSQGYWATAILPEQIFSEQKLIIQIVEAMYGKAIIEAIIDEKLNISSKKLEEFLNYKLEKNAILNSNQLEKNITNINSIPGIQGIANIQPGQEEGSTDVLLSVQNTPTLNLNTVFDNHGSRSSGEDRIVNSLSIHSLLNQGESFDIMQSHTNGSDYAALSIDLPLGYGGARSTFRYSEMTYNLGAPFNDTKPSGSSNETYASVLFDIVEIQDIDFKGNISISKNNYDNNVLTGKASNKYIEKISTGINFNMQDNFFLGGISYGDLGVTSGSLNLRGYETDYENDQLSAKTHGKFSKINLSIGKIQQITSKDQFTLKLSGQYADTNLDGAEQFSLGGISGIRAYPSGEGAGSQGYLANIELKSYLFSKFNIFAFYDFGMVQVYKNAYADWNSTNTTHKNKYYLKGAGLGANLIVDDNFNISYLYAKKLGNNNGKDTDGNDSDQLNLAERHLFSFQLNYKF